MQGGGVAALGKGGAGPRTSTAASVCQLMCSRGWRVVTAYGVALRKEQGWGIPARPAIPYILWIKKRMKPMLLPGTIVEHLFRPLGLCKVIGYGTTEIGWPVVIVEDAAGQQHQVNEIYLRRIKNERKI